MISYKLAKQLKDAGFPQPEAQPEYDSWTIKESRGSHYCTPVHAGKEPPLNWFDVGCSYYKDNVFAPTLSELIEACGDEIHTLKREAIPRMNNRILWGAYPPVDYLMKNKMSIEYAESPEEAVAKLWLKLNEKNNE